MVRPDIRDYAKGLGIGTSTELLDTLRGEKELPGFERYSTRTTSSASAASLPPRRRPRSKRQGKHAFSSS
jgi:hypothetical protein